LSIEDLPAGHRLIAERKELVMKSALGFALAVAAVIAATVAIGTFGQDPGQPGKMYIYSGVLRSKDNQARTITVEASAISQKFVVPTNAEIIVKDKPKGELTDLMVGDGVQVKYTEDDGALVAHQISLLGLKVP
jgi:hypothetical protein